MLEVAAAAIKNANGEILISRRADHLHQGGLWEFPGGKIEAGETPEQAVRREIAEELGLALESLYPLLTVTHRYSDRTVRLHVYVGERFSGRAQSLEGQPFCWVAATDLRRHAFPAANLPIVRALSLPPLYALLDDAEPDHLDGRLQGLLEKGVKLIQARLKNSSSAEAFDFLRIALPACRRRQALLLLNSGLRESARFGPEQAFDLAETLGLDGVHLTGRHLDALPRRPDFLPWLAASCHNAADMRLAQRKGVDFGVLGPVLPTPTHPGASLLGWSGFHALVENNAIPIYALGGMTADSLEQARRMGACGIAGIRLFLD